MTPEFDWDRYDVDPEPEIKMTVVAIDLVKLGYSPSAELLIIPSRRVYYVTLYLNRRSGARREVPYEPGEPNLGEQGCRWAAANPEAAVLQAAEIDKRIRKEEREERNT
jgi:hypothetical protein